MLFYFKKISNSLFLYGFIMLMLKINKKILFFIEFYFTKVHLLYYFYKLFNNIVQPAFQDVLCKDIKLMFLDILNNFNVLIYKKI
jgi:hypothetical protein